MRILKQHGKQALTKYKHKSTYNHTSFFFKSHFFQEQLMGGIIHEEDKEATKEDDIEYLVGSLGLVPPSTE